MASNETKKDAKRCAPGGDAKAAAVPPGMVRCRRVEAFYSPQEHAQCPYCYGKLADIKPGDYGKFCDFQPGKDPICFGFPADHGRYAH